METFNPVRRDLLRFGTFGAAAVTLPSFAQAAQPAGANAPLLYDIRTFGAVGDGKTVDSPAINKAIEAAAAAGGGMVFVPPERGSASPFGLRVTSTSTWRRDPSFSPPTRRSPARPPATTAAPTTRPSRRPPTTPTRTTVTTIGTTRSSGARA